MLSKHNFFNALKWSTAGELASKVIQPIIFIIMARLLTPGDYGVMASAVMIISLAQVFWDAGMNKALIQKQTDIPESANAVFWVNVAIGILFAILLFLLSGVIANSVFHDARVSLVLKSMTLQIILGSLGSVHTSLLQKEMKFSSLFWVRITTVAIPGLLSIPLAVYGLSYWALVAGTLAGQAAQAIVLWKICPWRPQFKFNFKLAKELGKFGAWVGLTGLLVWFYLWADSFIVGAYLGTFDLGLFRTGNTFVLMIFDGILFGPILPVLYSYLSVMSNDQKRVGDSSLKIIKIIAMISIPLCILLFALAEPICQFIFGDKWAGIGYVVGILSLMRGFGWLAGINGEIYRSIGKPHVETLIYAFSGLFFLIGFLISIQYGFKVFLITRLYLGMFSLLPHFFVFWLLFKQPLTNTVKTIVLSSTFGIIPIVLNLFIPNTWGQFLQIVLVSGISIFSFAVLYYFIEHKFVVSIVQDVKSYILKK